MRRKWITVVLCVAAIALGLLWLKELSQRLARERADSFMGPLLTVYTCTSMRLTPWFTDAARKTHGLTWFASYDSHLYLVDFPPQIAVSVFGSVMGAYGVGKRNDWLTLTEEDRDREQWLLVKAFHDTRNEREPNN
jgi:hypothetical protein